MNREVQDTYKIICFGSPLQEYNFYENLSIFFCLLFPFNTRLLDFFPGIAIPI